MRSRKQEIRAAAHVKGYFMLDGRAVRNKFTRNMGYIIDGLLRRANVSVYDEGGASRTFQTGSGGLIYGVSSASTTAENMGPSLFVQFGGGTTPPTVTDNNLAVAQEVLPTNYIDIVEETSTIRLVVAAKWTPDVDRGYEEVALKLFISPHDNWATMLSRAVVSPTVARNAYSTYFDGYALSFPATITKWFVRALMCASVGQNKRPTRCLPALDIDESNFVIQSADTFAGAPDVRIGMDNAPSSPSDANLRAPLGSLEGQTQTVEVDTAAQEVRVVRCGTIAPTSDTPLGEIGLFTTVKGYANGAATTRTIMVGRIPLPEVQTLYAGATYTICYVIKLA